MGKSVIRGGYGVVVAQDPVEVSGRVQIPLATPDDVYPFDTIARQKEEARASFLVVKNNA